MEGLSIVFVSREKQKSEYDWADIEFNDCPVGKARCLINGNEFTIFTITIYPEYQGKGYGSEFVKYAKLQYKKIIADSVRYAAVVFWEKLGFIKDGDTGNWIYKRQTINKGITV
jgi:GNAT superfamily N-acetyltransferase